jgi:hypothetical protein
MKVERSDEPPPVVEPPTPLPIEEVKEKEFQKEVVDNMESILKEYDEVMVPAKNE